MRGLGFPAARASLLPHHPQLLQPALERSALHEQNHQQEHEVEKQGKLRHRCSSANEAIEASNPRRIAPSVKREFSTIYVSSTRSTMNAVPIKDRNSRFQSPRCL